MKAMVIYDSAYGNTAQVAQSIGRGLGQALESSGEVELRRTGDVKPEQLTGVDLLVVGSPTQKARPTPATSDFLESIPQKGLQGVRVAAFDTRFSQERINALGFVASKLLPLFGFAAKPIANRLKKKGGKVVLPPEGFYVDDTEGPLSDGEFERAEQWAGQIVKTAST